MWQQIIFSLVCIILYIVYKYMDTKQNKVKYFSKILVMYFYVAMVTTIMSPVILLKKRDLRNSRLITNWLKHLASIYGMKWQLQNKEYLAREGGAVIISNHQSTMDAIGMFYAWDSINKIVVIVKKELWCLGLASLVAYMCGTVFIDRKNPKKAYESLLQVTKVLKDGAKIWMFPEGTRNSGTNVKLLPFKKGAFALAVAAQVPIIPIVSSPLYFINEKKCIFYNDGKVIMRCLEPVTTEGLTPEDIPELQKRLHSIVLDAFEQLSKEILNDLPFDTPLANKILI